VVKVGAASREEDAVDLGEERLEVSGRVIVADQHQ